MRLSRVIGAAVLLAACGLAARAAAQTSTPSAVQQQYWPELDYFQTIGDHSRLYTLASKTLGDTKELSETQVGVNLDLFLNNGESFADVIGAGSLVLDRHLPAMLRLGYRYSQGVDTGSEFVQHRLVAEFTGRVHLGTTIVADRNGLDWRWTDGTYSTRYRNRLYAERPVTVRSYELTPYADAEIFYMISGGYWSGSKYEAGVQLPVVAHFTIELYAARQYTWGASDADPIHAIGLNVVLSW